MAVNICTTFGVWSKCFGEAINTGINTPEFLFSRVTARPLSVAAARCGCQVSRRLWRGHGSTLSATHLERCHWGVLRVAGLLALEAKPLPASQPVVMLRLTEKGAKRSI